MTYKQMFESIVATNGLHAPERRRSQNNLKRLLVLIVLAIAVVTIGSSFS